MVDLALHDVQWSREQGHPILVLSIAGQSKGIVSIVLSPADAQMLAAKSPVAIADRLRLIGLFDSLLAALAGRLSEVRFHLDPGMVLAADLCFDMQDRQITLTANFADAVALAGRAGAPMRISQRDLRWIQAMHGYSSGQVSQRTEDSDLTTSVHAFIESLSLDDLGGPSERGTVEREH